MKTNKNLIKGVAGVLSTSILTASCTQYLPPEDYVYGNVTIDDSDLGQIAIPISIQLSPEDVQYINAIQSITTEIINSPQKAQEFNKDPKAVLAQYGYSGNINLDDDMLKITMALADKDLYEAIKKQDFKSFITQCMDKNLMTSNTILSSGYYKDQLDKIYQSKDYKKIKTLLETNNKLRFETSGTEPFLGIAIAVVAVGIVAAAAVLVYAVNAFWVTSGYAGQQNQVIATFDIYTLRAGMEENYIGVDNYTEEVIDDLISIVEEADP